MSAFDRLSRLEAAMPTPEARGPYDVSRLTPDQLERMAQLRRRVDVVGMGGLTDEEVDEGAVISEILLAPDEPTPDEPTSNRWRTQWQRTRTAD